MARGALPESAARAAHRLQRMFERCAPANRQRLARGLGHLLRLVNAAFARVGHRAVPEVTVTESSLVQRLPTIGCARWVPARDPWQVASPTLSTLPAKSAIQRPLPVAVAAAPTGVDAPLERHVPEGGGGGGGGGGAPPLVTVKVVEKYVSQLVTTRPLSVQHSAEIWNEGTLTVLGTVNDAVHEPSAHAWPLLLTFVLTFVPPHRVFGVNPMMAFCPPAGQGVTDFTLMTVPGPPLVGVTDMVAVAGGAV